MKPTTVCLALVLLVALMTACKDAPATSPSTTATATPTTTGPSHLAILQGTGTFTADFTALVTFRSGQSETTLPAVFFVHRVPITWSATSFAGHLEEQGAGEDITDAVQGAVSADGNMLVSLIYSRRVIRPVLGSGTAYTVILKDVPLGFGRSTGVFQGSEADVQRYVAAIQYADGLLSGGQIISSIEYVGTDWTASRPAWSPSLTLSFGG